MGLFNKVTKTVPQPEDRIGRLLETSREESDQLLGQTNYLSVLNLFKKAIDIYGSRNGATFSITVKEGQVIMFKWNDWQIYWLADDPEYITIQDNNKKFEKISADQETFLYTITHLDVL